jgi:hypothetical protein
LIRTGHLYLRLECHSDMSQNDSNSGEDHESSRSTPAQSSRKARKSHYVAPPSIPEDEEDGPTIVPQDDM